jgi:uncharacterized peroxidase-related enzyme
MNKIKTIEYNEAEGRLKEIYDNLISKRGKLAEVHKIQSLRPESIVKHMDLYMEIMYSRSLLSRPEREMMAVVVSKANNCEYCQIHHAEALKLFWKNEERVNQLRTDYRKLKLMSREMALCIFAEKLTKEPLKENNFAEELRTSGFNDEAILDAVLVTAYFNFVNRIVLALGVESEIEEGSGYKY